MHDQRRQEQREFIRGECAQRRIKVIQCGQTYSLRGPGVDLMTADLANLDVNDLAPFQPRPRERDKRFQFF